MSPLAKWMCVVGALTVALIAARPTVSDALQAPRPMAPMGRDSNVAWVTGDFRAGAVYPTSVAGDLPPGLETIGSWVEGDAWQGRAETPWFEARTPPRFVAIAGYPRNAGCGLWVEFRDQAGVLSRIAYAGPNPGERWLRWEIPDRADAVAWRLVGEDRSTALGGWWGMSQPYTTWPAQWAALYLNVCVVSGTLFASLALASLWNLRRGTHPASVHMASGSALPANDSPRRRAARDVVLGLGLVAVVIGPLQPSRLSVTPLPTVDAKGTSGAETFSASGVHPGIRLPEVPRGLAIRSSWLGSDAFQGRHESPWYEAQPRVTLMLVGYPALPGNALWLEVRRRDGSVR